MNVLYIGQFLPPKIEATIKQYTNGKIGLSNHNFELSLIEGFSHCDSINLRIITAVAIGYYPKHYKKIFIKGDRGEVNGIPIKSIGFCNLPFISMFNKIYTLANCIVSELRNFDGNEVKVIVNPHALIQLKALSIAKHLTTKKINTTLIVPDVPECVTEMFEVKGLKRKIMDYLNKSNHSLALKCDKFVFLTDAMNEYYQVSKNSYMIMEGLINQQRIKQVISSVAEEKSDKKIILYTGSLFRIFGIMNLLDAFESGKFNNTELWICGSGECGKDIEERSRRNPSIKFFGLVSPQRALELQTQATILANPRSASGNYTKYSFPSKTIEYMLAGKVVIMNRLPGIPEEYNEYLVYPDDESVSSWIKTFSKVLEMPEEQRETLGLANRYFILNSKTAIKQCKKIIDFIKN